MRRAVSSLIAAAALAGGLAVTVPVPAAAQECEGMGCAHYNYRETRHVPAYGSRYDGYWDRPGEHRRHWNRYNHRRYRDSGYHYYPGYGYYPNRRGYYDERYGGDGRGHGGHGYDGRGYDDRGGDRADWCARRYRSYDYRSGTYVGYDGYRHRC
jgi:hypothetical protein